MRQRTTMRETPVQAKERVVLTDFYDATGGKDNWHWKDNWCTPRPVSTWRGIETDDEGRVITVVLVSNNLCGGITQSIATLDFLTTLNLSANGKYDRRSETYMGGLSGKLPWRILLELRTLHTLILGDVAGGNQFETSQIPKAIGSMVNLRQLGLAHCNLSGKVNFQTKPKQPSQISFNCVHGFSRDDSGGNISIKAFRAT
jgi:hypothetical protein